MNIEMLVTMANQISQFFETQSDHDGAVASVHDHLRRFWEPRMRVAIIDHAAHGCTDLREVARDAVSRLAVTMGKNSTPNPSETT